MLQAKLSSHKERNCGPLQTSPHFSGTSTPPNYIANTNTHRRLLVRATPACPPNGFRMTVTFCENSTEAFFPFY